MLEFEIGVVMTLFRALACTSGVCESQLVITVDGVPTVIACSLQHDGLRRVKRTAYDDATKPRSASESEHVELLSSSMRIPLIDDSARSQKESESEA